MRPDTGKAWRAHRSEQKARRRDAGRRGARAEQLAIDAARGACECPCHTGASRTHPGEPCMCRQIGRAFSGR